MNIPKTKKFRNSIWNYYCYYIVLDGVKPPTNATIYWDYGFHRFDGPALINSPDEDTADEWWLFGAPINGEEYKEWLKEMGMDICRLTDDDITMISMKYYFDYEKTWG